MPLPEVEAEPCRGAASAGNLSLLCLPVLAARGQREGTQHLLCLQSCPPRAPGAAAAR